MWCSQTKYCDYQKCFCGTHQHCDSLLPQQSRHATHQGIVHYHVKHGDDDRLCQSITKSLPSPQAGAGKIILMLTEASSSETAQAHQKAPYPPWRITHPWMRPLVVRDVDPKLLSPYQSNPTMVKVGVDALRRNKKGVSSKSAQHDLEVVYEIDVLWYH